MGKNLRYIAGLIVIASSGQSAYAQFSQQNIISKEAQGLSQIYAVDLDNDGDVDVLSASLLDNKIAWYENLNGSGGFGGQQIVSQAAIKVSALHVADIDGDGDQDIISASRDDNKIAWYQNLGSGFFGSQQVISTLANVAQSVYSADLDGDGDQDVLSASRDDDKIAWYENLNGAGNFGPQQIISISATWAIRVIATDLDGDGDQDVISASEQDDKIAWYQNQDGAGNFSQEIIISVSSDAVRDIRAVDIDNDGDDDILAASAADDTIAWFENTDGLGTFGPEKVISTQADFAHAVYGADIDLDGDLDVLSASINDSKIAWYENTDGLGSFGSQQIISSAFGAVAVIAANVDGDEDMDILSAASFDNTIAWYESFFGKGRVHFGPLYQISGVSEAWGAHSVHGSDIDGDGDIDVLSASHNDNTIAWYPNVQGSLGPRQIITASAAGARDVFAADIDGDGDQDVLSASAYDNAIRWYENYDGLGSFDLIHLVTVNAANAYAVYAADLDGDGDQDLLSASSADDAVAWYKNLDGKGDFSDQIIISKAAKGATDVVAADFDGDGDMDVASASTYDDKIAWYENTDGKGTFGGQIEISIDADLAIALHVSDVDADGDLDILSASSGDNKIAWYKNLDGEGTFSAQKIVSLQAQRAFSVYTSDLDSDGDQDIISGSRDDNKVAWYENLGGDRFSQELIITNNAQGVRSVTAFDLDQDGDPDVLSASQDDHRIAWYENLSFTASAISSESPVDIAGGFGLGEVYPNPFRQQANVALTVDKTQHVDVFVFDIQGRRVDVLHQGMLVGGQPHMLQFRKNGLAAGLYIIRVQGEFFYVTRKTILMP